VTFTDENVILKFPDQTVHVNMLSKNTFYTRVYEEWLGTGSGRVRGRGSARG
jgi:hypothetical protein